MKKLEGIFVFVTKIVEIILRCDTFSTAFLCRFSLCSCILCEMKDVEILNKKYIQDHEAEYRLLDNMTKLKYIDPFKQD